VKDSVDNSANHPPSHPVDDPAATRHALGIRLRLLRRRAGLSGPQLAARLGWSQSKVSRIETAERHAALPDVQAWLDATTNDPATHTEVTGLAERVLAAAAGTRNLHRGTLHHPHATDLRHAIRVRHVAPWSIPPPFQPPHYTHPHPTEDQQTQRQQTQRQETGHLPPPSESLLSGTGPDYHLLITETALHWTGTHTPPDVLRHAWTRLHDAAHRPHITIQIIPAAAPRPDSALCAFTLIDRPFPHQVLTAVMDTPIAAVTFTGQQDLAIFETLWTHLHATALDQHASTAWLGRLLGRPTLSDQPASPNTILRQDRHDHAT
jgi:transcriptional regulator with XRE-family HTH domain